jgi:hypothetical protein
MIGATTKFIIEFAAGAREKKGGCLVRTLRVLCVWKKRGGEVGELGGLL